MKYGRPIETLQEKIKTLDSVINRLTDDWENIIKQDNQYNSWDDINNLVKTQEELKGVYLEAIKELSK